MDESVSEVNSQDIVLGSPNKSDGKPNEQEIGDWKRSLLRVIRRSMIRKNLDKDSLRSIVNEVIEEEGSKGVGELVDALVDCEYVVDPEVSSKVMGLSDYLTQEHPDVLAVIVLGSAIHGGSTLRKILSDGGATDNIPAVVTSDTENTGEKSTGAKDLDWGIITYGETSEDDRSLVVELAETWLRDNAAVKPISLKSCGVANARKVWTPMLRGQEDAITIVGEFIDVLGTLLRDPESMVSFDYDLPLYFAPSYPPTVNMLNRRYLLSALQNIHSYDPKTADMLIDYIVEDLKGHHLLKRKHFVDNLDPRSEKLASTVVKSSATVMSSALRELLKGSLKGEEE